MRALFLIAAVSFATQLPARDVPMGETQAKSHGPADRCIQAEVIAGAPNSGEAISPLLAPQRSMI